MENQRVFQRTNCSIPVVVHSGGRFLYGEIIDLSLGGVRLKVKGKLSSKNIELTPNKTLPPGMAVIPLPYEVRWEETGEHTYVGLKFSSGTDAFFRGWLSEHLNPAADFLSLLDHRKLVRMPCQLTASITWEEGKSICAVLDVSRGGLSFVTKREVFEGLTLSVELTDHQELGNLELILLRVQELTGHYLCGGRFLEPTDEQVNILNDVVLSLAKVSKTETAEE